MNHLYQVPEHQVPRHYYGRPGSQLWSVPYFPRGRGSRGRGRRQRPNPPAEAPAAQQDAVGQPPRANSPATTTPPPLPPKTIATQVEDVKIVQQPAEGLLTRLSNRLRGRSDAKRVNVPLTKVVRESGAQTDLRTPAKTMQTQTAGNPILAPGKKFVGPVKVVPKDPTGIEWEYAYRNGDEYFSTKHGGCLSTENTKPPFILHPMKWKMPRTFWQKLFCTGETASLKHLDQDLVSYLRLEAAFLPRTPGLARSLITSAKRFMHYFDKTHIQRSEMTKIVMESVAVAMNVSKHELKCWKVITSEKALEARQQAQEMMDKLL
uniref:Uncharacterized protein n=1 Tax=Hemipteran tombus-related virus TaxID=2822554 RepID=A0A8A6RH49_9TOMB|nr:hypothetical protein [Hemipteran tombus-related virus]